MRRFYFVILFLILSTYLFAENYKIEVQQDFDWFGTENYSIQSCIVSEICPVNNNYCKISFLHILGDVETNTITILPYTYYVSLDEKVYFIELVEENGELKNYEYELKITSFTYNEITTDVTRKQRI